MYKKGMIITTYYITPNGIKTKYNVEAMILIPGENTNNEILVKFKNNTKYLIPSSWII
mgnify:FL=1